MSQLRSRLVAVTAASALAATGLVATTAAPAGASTGRTVQVFITKSSVVRMSTHLRPGLHRFVIRAGKAADFQIIKPRAGYTKTEIVHDVQAGLENNDIPSLRRFERNTTLLGGVSAKKGHPGVMWERLHRGTYWAVDTAPQKLPASRIRTLHVSGARLAGTAPRADAVIRAIHETTWAPAPRAIPHRGIMSFRNDATDNHFVEIARLLPGKTVADLRDWINLANEGSDPGAPPLAENGGVSIGVVSPGHRVSVRYSAPAGNYVLLCFWPDADMGGKPHAFMGMYRGITLR